MLSFCCGLGGGRAGWGGVCTVIFMSNPTTKLRLCCVVVGVVTILQIGLRFDLRKYKMFY